MVIFHGLWTRNTLKIPKKLVISITHYKRIKFETFFYVLFDDKRAVPYSISEINKSKSQK